MMKSRWILTLVAIASLTLFSCSNKRTETRTQGENRNVENTEIQSEQDITEYTEKMYADIFSVYSTSKDGMKYAMDKYASTRLKTLEEDVSKAILNGEIDAMCYGWDGDPWLLAQDYSHPAAKVLKVYDIHKTHCMVDMAINDDLGDGESRFVTLTLIKENGQWKVDDFAKEHLLGDMTYRNMLRRDFESAKVDIFKDMVYVEGDTASFYLCKYEVTQALWERVMGDNPSQMQGKDLPVEQVSWDDCQAFIRKFNELTGGGYRLPTEAEWEYACRGGKYSKGYKYSGSNNLDAVAWYDENSGGKTHPVGQKQPNELGLYDMSGNVWEWCQDMHEGIGMCRGGSWIHNARNCDPSLPNETPRAFSINSLGLRLALDK